MVNKGILLKNYYIVPEAVVDLGAEVYNMMAEADQAMAEASEIIAEIASLTERVPSHIRCDELLEECASAQAEIKSVDFLSYGQKVNQGLQNLLDHNQYITEHFIKNMETHTEKMRGLGEEFKRLSELITYSGENVQLNGIASSAVSNAEAENTDIDDNAEEITITREEFLQQEAARLSGAKLDAYGIPTVNSADDAKKATLYHQYLESVTVLTRDELVRWEAARLSGVSLNAHGEPVVNSTDEATLYYHYLARDNFCTRDDLIRQAAAKMAGITLNEDGRICVVHSYEEAMKIQFFNKYLDELRRGEYSYAQIAAVLADVANSDMQPEITNFSDAINYSNYLSLLRSITYTASIVEYIKQSEKLVLELYNDGQTIAYGFDLNSHSNIVINFQSDGTITEEEAERLLCIVLDDNAQTLNDFLEENGYEITQNAYDAAIDLIYNRGFNDCTKEVIIAMIEKNDDEVKTLLDNFNVKFYIEFTTHGEGTLEDAENYLASRQGLITRRNDEYNIYRYGFDLRGDIICGD